MGKRKGNFNGPDYYRKQMAGPYRQQQRPPMQPQQQAPTPGPSAPRRPRSPTEEADGPGYQVQPKIPKIPDIPISEVAAKFMADAAATAGLSDWPTLSEAEMADRDKNPISVIENGVIRNASIVHVTPDVYPLPSYAMVSPFKPFNSVIIVPRY
jgi:hypothetical protein